MHESGKDSFEDWSRARQQELLRVAFWLTGDLHRAEDLVQDALIETAMRWDSLRTGNPDGWVRTVMYRRNVSWWRRRRREVLTDNVPDLAASQLPDDALDLRNALIDLPPKQRAVVCLRYLEDLSIEQTAAILGVSAGTVKKQSSLGLAKLRTGSRHLEAVEDPA